LGSSVLRARRAVIRAVEGTGVDGGGQVALVSQWKGGCGAGPGMIAPASVLGSGRAGGVAGRRGHVG